MTDFDKEVLERSKEIPILVDFWAEWCGPCRVLGPILDRLSKKYKDDWELVKLNTDENPEISQKYGIKGIPNVKLFIDGKVTDEFTGALPEHMIESWLKKAIPNKFEGKIKEANILLANNESERAKIILESILAEDPGNEGAQLILAKAIIFNDWEKAENLAKNADTSVDNLDLVEALQTFAHLFEIKDKLAEYPQSDVKEEYFSAIEYLKEKNFELALEKFINVIRNDRNYDNDGARKACVATFKYLGEDNPITLKYRRDFGSALYV